MSASARNHEARHRAAVRRALGAGRTRRAGTGTVTEMARELLREAREAGHADVLAAPTAQAAPSEPALPPAEAA